MPQAFASPNPDDGADGDGTIAGLVDGAVEADSEGDSPGSRALNRPSTVSPTSTVKIFH
jgi:hypothetical protein